MDHYKEEWNFTESSFIYLIVILSNIYQEECSDICACVYRYWRKN